MDFVKDVFKKEITKRILVLCLIIFFMYILRGMLNLFLLTFLFTYTTYTIQTGITSRLDKYIKIKPVFITILIYALMFFFIVFVIYKYIPMMITQMGDIGSEISKFNFNNLGGEFGSTYLTPYINKVDITKMSKGVSYNQVLKYVANVGTWGFNVFMAMILSFFFMIEREKLKIFVSQFENSRISPIYKYARIFAKNFLNSFGKVISAQILIAAVNSILSVIAFWIMGFPQLLGLGVMIFMFSLVPVAGTIASLLPLSIIAYTVGGFKEILYVLILIGILHALESYVLNPKFMADKTELPVFVIFVTLLVSEHFMGIWGLLLGVPLLMFILDFLDIEARIKNI